ncbi:MAG TPA: hypothetical protein VKG25_27230 [Bryobacteraceae bacterium]|nr:hypothetical protein [Bryobacteraceae bacterium]
MLEFEQHTLHNVEAELEANGRWIVEIADVPGLMVYGETKEEAVGLARELAQAVIADRDENEGR